LYLRFFLFAIAAAFVLGITGIEAQQAFADLIDFETGFVDKQPVGVVVTATNTVTFEVGFCDEETGTGFIAKNGTLTTAFVPEDKIPAGGGLFFLTDETAGPSAKLDYCISFATPVKNLSLDLYDYRTDGGASVGSNATLTVFDASGTSVGSVKFTVTARLPDPNVATLSIQNPTGLISSAQLSFNKADVGTGIDNIRFTNTIVLSIDAGSFLGSFIHKIDPNTGATISSVEITLDGSFSQGLVVNGGTGIAFNPVDGKIYALLRVSDDPGSGEGGGTGGGLTRHLATIDPQTGIATLVGDTGVKKIASLTFDSGTLFSVNVGKFPVNSTLSTISTVDGSVTDLCELNTSPGTGLAFNPNDGFLYYTTSGSFQRINDFNVEGSCNVRELAPSIFPENPTALVFFATINKYWS